MRSARVQGWMDSEGNLWSGSSQRGKCALLFGGCLLEFIRCQVDYGVYSRRWGWDMSPSSSYVQVKPRELLREGSALQGQPGAGCWRDALGKHAHFYQQPCIV